MDKKFEISYLVVLRGGFKEPHTTKVSKCDHEAHAKMKLDKYCSLKYKSRGYVTIEVISCKDVTVEEFFTGGKDIFGDKGIFDSFSKIFGGFGKSK